MTSELQAISSSDEQPLPVRSSHWPRVRCALVLKIATSAILLVWIISRAKLEEIVTGLWSANILVLLAAYAMTVIATGVSISRWRLLLQAQGAALPRLSVLRSYLVAMFFNNFLPSTVGGDASRAYDCYRMTGGNRGAMSSVVLDRLLGLLALVLLAIMSLNFALPLSEHLPALPLWLGLAVAGLAGVIGGIFFGLPSGRLRRAIARLPQIVQRQISVIGGAFELYRGQWRTLILAFALSLVLQFSVIVQFILIAQALRLEVPAIDFCLIVPLVTFVIVLPISINGIGLRENALAVMLGYYGVDTADAVALAWLVYLGSAICALAGGIIYSLRR